MTSITRRAALESLAGLAAVAGFPGSAQAAAHAVVALGTPQRTGIHDVAPAPDGGVWFSAQRSGHLGWFEPKTGRTELVALGAGSSPHGVIQGPDRAAWLTDGGQNAIVRVSWPGREVRVFRLPEGTPYANLNTAAFDGDGHLWYTGQAAWSARCAGKTRRGHGAGRAARPRALRHLRDADRRRLVVLAGGVVHRAHRPQDGRLDHGRAADQGPGRAARVERQPRAHLGERVEQRPAVRARPGCERWRAWKLPGREPRAYAVYVDAQDQVWVSDFGANAVLRFDPARERFESFAFPREAANVRQILGRPARCGCPRAARSTSR